MLLTGPIAEKYGFPTVLIMTTGLVSARFAAGVYAERETRHKSCVSYDVRPVNIPVLKIIYNL